MFTFKENPYLKKTAELLILCKLLFLLSCPEIVFASDPHWITVDGKSLMAGHVKADARNRAIRNAEETALYQFLARDISSTSLWVNFRLQGTIIGVIPYGRIIEKKILKEYEDHLEGNTKTTPGTYYRVKMKARVQRDYKGLDPHNRIDLGLNRIHFKKGDQMQIYLRPTKSIYYYLFIVMENDQVLRLIPNRYKQDNYLKAGQTAVFPNKKDVEKGIFLQLELPEKKKRTSEMIYVIGLKKPMPMDHFDIQEGIYGIYDGQTAFLKDIIQKVTRIPLKDRTDALIRYYIESK